MTQYENLPAALVCVITESFKSRDLTVEIQ